MVLPESALNELYIANETLLDESSDRILREEFHKGTIVTQNDLQTLLNLRDKELETMERLAIPDALMYCLVCVTPTNNDGTRPRLTRDDLYHLVMSYTRLKNGTLGFRSKDTGRAALKMLLKAVGKKGNSMPRGYVRHPLALLVAVAVSCIALRCVYVYFDTTEISWIHCKWQSNFFVT